MNKTKYELKYQYFSKIDENSSFSNFWVEVEMTVNLKIAKHKYKKHTAYNHSSVNLPYLNLTPT